MRFFKQIFAVLAVLCATYAHGEVVEGKDYKLMSSPQPTTSGKKVEVLEFFFYGCSHCYHLHPFMTEWEKKKPKDVELKYVPVIFNESAEPMARAFYAVEAMGQLNKMHDELFKSLYVLNVEMNDEKSITDFVAKYGVDRAKFGAAYNSFAMQSKITRSNQMVQSYGIRGTPTIVVDGKYAISGLQPERIVEVLDEVVKIARKERPGHK
jgi:protein dithiol oxidoreductase (disulfide-forming)